MLPCLGWELLLPCRKSHCFTYVEHLFFSSLPEGWRQDSRRAAFVYQIQACSEKTFKAEATLNLIVLLLVAKCNFINSLNLLSPVHIFSSEEPFVLRDIENKALGICYSNGNVFNSALQVIHAHLTEAGTEIEQMYNGGWLIAGGLTELSAQCKAVCSEVFLVYFWAFSRSKNQDSSSFLGVFVYQHWFRICLLTFPCPPCSLLCWESKNPVGVFVCSGILGFFLSFPMPEWFFGIW